MAVLLTDTGRDRYLSKREVSITYASVTQAVSPIPTHRTESTMPESLESRPERYLRFSHRSLVALFIIMLVVGGLCLRMALTPGDTPRWMTSLVALLPTAIAIGVVTLQRTTLRGDRWDSTSPEVQAVLQDEWRRVSMDRAIRVAFFVILIAQIPIGLLVAPLPSLRAAMAMATTTLTLGMATFLALFLFFSRQGQDEQ